MNSTMECLVCGAPATEPHYGADVCRACAAFFRRRVLSRFPAQCDQPTPCRITNDRDARQCKSCRMEKCLRVGMKLTNVQSKRDKHGNEKIPVKPSSEILPYGYSKITLDLELQGSSSTMQYPQMHLKSIHRYFTEMLQKRKSTFPKRNRKRSLHHTEALSIFRKDVQLAAKWIDSSFPELSLVLEPRQRKLVFRNFYLKWTVFEAAFLAVLLGKPTTYHLPTGDTVDEVSRYYTTHLDKPLNLNLDEVSRLFSPYWTDFRNTLMDPVIGAKISIHEFLLLTAICLFDVGLDGQTDECLKFCETNRQQLFRELNIVCKELCRTSSEDPCFRFAQNMLLLPGIQRGIAVFEEELQLGGLYKFLSTDTDDWYSMVGGPSFEEEKEKEKRS